jgi:hypothetical protein
MSNGNNNNNNINSFNFYKEGRNTFVIPKKLIPRLREKSALLNTLISRNFSDANEYFDNDDNYLLKKDLLPEMGILVYDRKTNDNYVISRDDVFDALPGALLDYHVTDPYVAKAIEMYFMFDDNIKLFNPTVPEQPSFRKARGYYVARPGKKQRQKTRKAAAEAYSNEWNMGPTNKELVKAAAMAERRANNENAEALAEAVLGSNRVKSVMQARNKAMREYSKYPKSGLRPSRHSRTTAKHSGNKRSRQQERRFARTHKQIMGNRN